MVKNIASAKKRVLGGVLDIIIVFAIITFLAVFLRGSPTTSFIPALILILYFIVMEAMTGKTLGKYIVKTKVVNKAGEKISLGQSIGRNLMRFIDGIPLPFYIVGFIAILASKNNQRLGDMVSKTYVVNV